MGVKSFSSLCPGPPLEVALERANELNRASSGSIRRIVVLKPITISAGVAIFPEHGSTGKDVIRAADAALYRAKEEGRDRVCLSGMG